MYDSTKDTLEHIEHVRDMIDEVMLILRHRSAVHDESKLEEPEKKIFDRMTPRLAGSTYGSEEYKAMLAEMKPALDHHYERNRHHPEHYENGIDGMTLIDVLEMLRDWKAATLRHGDGSIYNSLKINRERFGISDQLNNILLNTVCELWGG
jgi:hypothetical protein